MKLSQFKFKLPEDQIALEPPHRVFENEDGSVEKVYHRDECRLMVVHRKSQTVDMFQKDADGNDTTDYLTFKNVIDYFDEGDVFVFNDTKVFPARLFGTKEKTDAKIEVFLLRELNEELRLWDVLVEPARKIRIGNKLFFDEEGPMVAEVIDNTTSRGRTLRFLYDCPHDEFKQMLFGLGEAPLPRYIIDRRPATEEDMTNFQTIYAKNEGAVTAPATGLHFSRELMKRMEIKGINFAFITLHCGLGNFDAIEVEDLTKHKVPAVVQAWFIGSEAGEAIASVLAGDVNPSGKLPFTWYASLGQCGAHATGSYPGNWREDYKIIDEEYKEGIYVGYRYTDANKLKPLFAFGHGLSYTTFKLGKVTTNTQHLTPSTKLTFTVPVTNTGKVAGSETVQLYIAAKQSKVDRPVKELKAFQKVYLQPGETRNVTLTIGADAVSYYDETANSWCAEPGTYEALIGTASDKLPTKYTFKLK